MKQIAFLLLLFSFSTQAKAESFGEVAGFSENRSSFPKPILPASWSLQQLYISFGAEPAITYAPELQKGGLVAASHLNVSFSKSTFFRVGYNYAGFSDNLKQHPDITYKGSSPPQHELQSFYASVGKRKQLGNSFLIQASVGLSYNQHFEPVNIRYTKNYGFNFLGLGDPFEYEMKRKDKAGVLVQTEILVAEHLNYFGISLGPFFHYVPTASHAGITLALNPGLLSRK